MNHRAITMLAASLLAATLCLGNLQPVRADGAASTRNIILGAAAVAAGIIIGSNVAHKRELAATVAGYTSDGGTVYADGRVVYANGGSYYPNDRGQQIACRNMSCTIFSGGASSYNGYSQWNGSTWVAAGAPPAYDYQPGAYAPPNGYAPPPNYQYQPQPATGYPAYGDSGAYYNRYSAYAAAYQAYYEAYKVYYKAYYEHYNSLRYRSYSSSGTQAGYPQQTFPGYAPRSVPYGEYCCAPQSNPYLWDR